MRCLWYTSLWELAFAFAFFYVDFIPWFGTSTGVSAGGTV